MRTVVPAEARIISLDLAGRLLIETIEQAIATAEAEGGFPQVAGMHLNWAPGRGSGPRVRKAEIGTPDAGFSPLRRDRLYRVATTTDLVRHTTVGAPIRAHAQPVHTVGALLLDAVAAHIGAASPYLPDTEDRLVAAR